MKITLCAIEGDLYDAFRFHCGGLPNVDFACDLFQQKADGCVSPGNSFGFMDGGIDELYRRRFKPIEGRVQYAIANEWHGELPVGCATGAPTSDKAIPCLIVAPTMRVPMILPKDTVNPYLACRAAILKAYKLKLKSLLIPGLGTGVGRVPYEICAKQVRQAIDDACNSPAYPKSWLEASGRHQKLYGDAVVNLQ